MEFRKRIEGKFLKASLPFLVLFHLSSCANKVDLTDPNSPLVNKFQYLIEDNGGVTYNLKNNKVIE